MSNLHSQVRQSWLSEAQDAQTPSGRLTVLYQDACTRVNKVPHNLMDGAVRREQELLDALVRNPNASPDLLIQLLTWNVSIKTVLENPVLPFLLLEDPDWLRKLNMNQRQYLLSYADIPLPFVQYMAGGTLDKPMKKLPAKTPEHLVQRLIYANQKNIADEARHHILLAGELSETVWKDALRAYVRAYCAKPWSLQENSAARAAEIEQERQLLLDYVELELLPSWGASAYQHDEPFLPHCEELSDEERTVRNVRTSPQKLGQLYKKNEAYHVALAQNTRTPRPVLTLLAQSHDPLVRRLIRRNPSTKAFAVKETRYGAVTNAGQFAGTDAPVESPIARIVRAVNGTPPYAPNFQRTSPPSWWQDRLAFALCPSMKSAQEQSATFVNDGNQFVRAAARTRIADPDFVLTWEDEV